MALLSTKQTFPRAIKHPTWQQHCHTVNVDKKRIKIYEIKYFPTSTDPFSQMWLNQMMCVAIQNVAEKGEYSRDCVGEKNCFQKIEEPFVSRGAPVFLQNIGRKTAFRKFSDLLFPEGNHPLLVANEDGPHLLKLLNDDILFTNGAGNQYVGVVGALGGSYLLISGP